MKERERSIREEHVDGGYLVTMGTYTAAEDFWKAVVRQLIVSFFFIIIENLLNVLISKLKSGICTQI